MAGLPLTAWALRHPWGSNVDAVFDRLRDPPAVDEVEAGSGMALTGELLDELSDPCARACSRWGPSRVAIVLTGASSAADASGATSPALTLARERTGITGPAYHLVAAGGAETLASAERLLRASLVDAVLAGAVDDDRGALVILERHGDAFVELQASAEAVATPGDQGSSEAAIRRAVSSAWSAVGRPMLGYAHTHASPGPHRERELRTLRAVLGSVPCLCTHAPGSPVVSSDGAVAVVLATASLLRGFTPQAPPHELDHDRVLVHSSSSAGHHVALLLGARP